MFNRRKGHRPPPQPVNASLPAEGGPKPGEPGWHEPYVEGFDGESWEKSESFRSSEALKYELFYKYKDEMAPEVAAFWEKQGIRKELFDRDVEDGAHRYAVHTPLKMPEGKKLPLIYFCHGGMQDPYQAECSGYSLLIREEPMIVVFAHNGGLSNETAPEDFKKILDTMLEKGYPIDESRIYAAGFSSGSDAAESIGTLWPEIVAAVSPAPGSNAMYNSFCRVTKEAYEKCETTRVPLLCIGGTADFGDCYPFPDEECIENFNIWAAEISKVRGYEPITFEQSQALHVSDGENARGLVGVDFTGVWDEFFEERMWHFGEFYGENNEPVIRFIIADDLPHVVTGSFKKLTWDFFRHWSKDPATGESIYTK